MKKENIIVTIELFPIALIEKKKMHISLSAQRPRERCLFNSINKSVVAFEPMLN